MTAAPDIAPQKIPALPIVVFQLDEQRFALRLSAVERVLPMVEVTSLPRAPEIVVGIINIEGRVVSVLDIRARFALPRRPAVITDHLLVARTAFRSVAIVVDQVCGIVETANITTSKPAVDGTYVEGVARLDDGLVLIHDLDTFLSPGEANTLDAALASTREQ